MDLPAMDQGGVWRQGDALYWQLPNSYACDLIRATAGDMLKIAVASGDFRACPEIFILAEPFRGSTEARMAVSMLNL